MRISDWSSDVCSSDLLIDIDVEYLRCTAIAECVALVIAVAALRLQVPSIAHERVHLLIAIECGGPAVESAQRDILGNVRGIPGLELAAREIGRASGRERVCQ